MERIKPFLFWIVLAAVVVVLIVIRVGPVAAINARTNDLQMGFRNTYRALEAQRLRGDNLPRPSRIQAAKDLGEAYAKASETVAGHLIDMDSEFWPEISFAGRNYIDFVEPPTGTDRLLVLVQVREAQRSLIQRVADSIQFVNADPDQGPHGILMAGRSAELKIKPSGSGVPELPEVLRIQRLLWLHYELNRIITDPEVDVRMLHARTVALGDDVGMPILEDGRKQDKAFVTLPWSLIVTVPPAKVPVLLRKVALSRRHLEVLRVTLSGEPGGYLDLRLETDPLKVEEAKYQAGRRVRVALEGVSFDFLITEASVLKPGDVLDWPELAARLVTAGVQADRPSPGRRVWELLVPEARATLQTIAATRTIDEAAKAALRDALNEQVIHQSAFYEAAAFAGVALSGEAQALLDARNSRPLSEREVRRLNRLLLESAFPKIIDTRYRGWPT